jgi:hypothetical protein
MEIQGVWKLRGEEPEAQRLVQGVMDTLRLPTILIYIHTFYMSIYTFGRTRTSTRRLSEPADSYLADLRPPVHL